MSKPRVLLIAESASPWMVSVPLEGWSHSRAIAKLADVHTVTQVRNRPSFLKHGLVEGKDFTAIDTEYLARPFGKIGNVLRGGKGKGWTTGAAFNSITYYAFEEQLWNHFKGDLAAGKYDLVHRLIPLTPTTPSLIAARCAKMGIPFVLGPLNGGVPWPKGFDHVRREENEWLSYVRDAYKLMPGYRSTRTAASAIIIGSRDTFSQLPKRYHNKAVYIPENAIDPDRFVSRRARKTERPLRMIFVGRLVPYKGADMLLEAAAPLLASGAAVLEIVGDGPQMPELKEIIARQNIGHAVTLAGWVKHGLVQGRLLENDLFVFPSIREFGGAVALEAMAVGVVPLVMNYGGLGELVTPKTGFLLDMASREKIIKQLAALLTKLVENPALIDERSAPAIARAHEKFTWDAKARHVAEVYDWVLGRKPKPDFPMPIPD